MGVQDPEGWAVQLRERKTRHSHLPLPAPIKAKLMLLEVSMAKRGPLGGSGAEWPLKYACLVAKSCQTLCDPMDCIRSGSSVHGIS